MPYLGGAAAFTWSATAAPPASATPVRCPSTSARRSPTADLVVAAVLCGQPQLRGPDQPATSGELPRLPAAGGRLRPRRRHRHRPHQDPLGIDRNGEPGLPAGTSGRGRGDRDDRRRGCQARAVPHAIRARARGRRRAGTKLASARTGELYQWDEKSTYVAEPPFFEELPSGAGPVPTSGRARAGRARRFGHHRPHLPGRHRSPRTARRRQYLIEQGVEPKDFNSYGARRGNHEVMVRGTFANIRLQNLLVPGVEGGVTVHLPDGASR